jgi:hypothetical protein
MGNFPDRFRASYPSISPRDIDSGRFNGDDLDEIKRRAVSPSAIRAGTSPLYSEQRPDPFRMG